VTQNDAKILLPTFLQKQFTEQKLFNDIQYISQQNSVANHDIKNKRWTELNYCNITLKEHLYLQMVLREINLKLQTVLLIIMFTLQLPQPNFLLLPNT
jgi:hypothetical protein